MKSGALSASSRGQIQAEEPWELAKNHVKTMEIDGNHPFSSGFRVHGGRNGHMERPLALRRGPADVARALARRQLRTPEALMFKGVPHFFTRFW